MHNAIGLAELCQALAVAMTLDGTPAPPRSNGELHGDYTPKAQTAAHPRPMGVIGALFASNEAVDESSGCVPPDVSSWLKQLTSKSPMWELQMVALATFVISDKARASLALSCPQPVVETWLNTLPDRVRGKMFGRHGGKPLAVIQPAVPASQLVVSEMMALRRAYEYCECV